MILIFFFGYLTDLLVSLLRLLDAFDGHFFFIRVRITYHHLMICFWGAS